MELPGLTDPAKAAEVIGRTAQLAVHLVLSGPDAGPAALTLPDEEGRPLPLGPAALTGTDVSGAGASFDAQSGRGWVVSTAAPRSPATSPRTPPATSPSWSRVVRSRCPWRSLSSAP